VPILLPTGKGLLFPFMKEVDGMNIAPHSAIKGKKNLKP
jgi:hypothetical protein